jgi:hypothetical protein
VSASITTCDKPARNPISQKNFQFPPASRLQISVKGMARMAVRAAVMKTGDRLAGQEGGKSVEIRGQQRRQHG